MSSSKRSYHSKRRLHTTAKLAALIAALGVVTMMLEQPRLSVLPRHSAASIEQSIQSAYGGAAAAPRSASESTAPEESPRASKHLPVYFPGAFPLPDGEVEPQPTGF
jgi:hypothetical protein